MRAMLVLAAGCRLGFDRTPPPAIGDAATSDDDAVVYLDAPADAPPPTGPFGGITAVTSLNMGGDADDPTLTGDLLEVFFNTSRAPNAGGNDIFTATRATPTGAWTSIASVTVLNTGGDDATPAVSRDGLTMFYVGNGSMGMKDVQMTTRATRQSAWSAGVQIDALSTSSDESGPTLTPDLLVMYLSSNVSTDDDVYVASRASIGAAWSTPVLVPMINSPTADDGEPFINGTNTFLLWSSNRGGTYDIWMSRRATPTDSWGTPQAVTELNTSADERDPWLSPDERTLYFVRGTSVYTATR